MRSKYQWIRRPFSTSAHSTRFFPMSWCISRTTASRFFKYCSESTYLVELFRIKTDVLQNPDECIRERANDRPVRSTAFRGAFLVHARTLFEHHYDSSVDLHILRATASDRIMQSSLYMYTPSGELAREVKIRQSLKQPATCSFLLSLNKLAIVEHKDGVFSLKVFQLQRTADIHERKTKLS